jgi:hypothetical protein
MFCWMRQAGHRGTTCLLLMFGEIGGAAQKRKKGTHPTAREYAT